MQLGVQFSAAARGSNFRRRFQLLAALVGTVLIALRHPGEWALWQVFLAWLAISVPLAALTEYVATRVRHWRQAEELPRVTAADLEDRFKPQNGTLMAELDASKQREFSARQQRDAAQEQAGVAQRQRDDYKQQLEAVQRERVAAESRREGPPQSGLEVALDLKDFIRRRKSAENVGFWPVLGGLGAPASVAQMAAAELIRRDTLQEYRVLFERRVQDVRKRIRKESPLLVLNRAKDDLDNLIENGPEHLVDVEKIAGYLVFLETGK